MKSSMVGRNRYSNASILPTKMRTTKASTSRRQAKVCRPMCAVEGMKMKPLRLIQNKSEAKLFYSFLSKVYDTIVNPGHWTEDMRHDALKPLCLASGQKVYDIGGGTGFCTLGVLEFGVEAKNITLVDQSVGQLEKAREKKELQDVQIFEGDAEDLSPLLETDSADRYVSAGSIEYWPNPQKGICEAFRVIKPGGKACIIGPVHPTYSISSFFADLWMLFPTEEEYLEWFEKAGFENVTMTRIGPKWYQGERGHGLIMGCSVTGDKPVDKKGASELTGTVDELREDTTGGIDVGVIFRSFLGSIGGLYYFLLPIYMWLKYHGSILLGRKTT